MIKYCENKAQIISLWSEVFGDSEEEILFFIENLKNGKCLAYYENNVPVSMLYLIDCCIDNKKGKYIYAACTSKKNEGRGLMSSLIEFSAELDTQYLCLIPANDSLIDFYSKRGFSKSAEISSLEFDEEDEIKEYLFEGYKLSNPKIMIYEVK